VLQLTTAMMGVLWHWAPTAMGHLSMPKVVGGMLLNVPILLSACGSGQEQTVLYRPMS